MMPVLMLNKMLNKDSELLALQLKEQILSSHNLRSGRKIPSQIRRCGKSPSFDRVGGSPEDNQSSFAGL
jgi:hypothetical protein